MKQIKSCFRFAVAISIIVMLHACAIPKKETTPVVVLPQPTAPQKILPQPTPSQAELNEGVSLYDQGDFNGAIKKLGSANEIWNGDKTSQLRALKYMAFSYCVTSRQTLCRQQFDKALLLEPTFDLEPGEKMHPLWGPVFDQARKNALNPAVSTGNPSVKRKKTKVIRKKPKQ